MRKAWLPPDTLACLHLALNGTFGGKMFRTGSPVEADHAQGRLHFFGRQASPFRGRGQPVRGCPAPDEAIVVVEDVMLNTIVDQIRANVKRNLPDVEWRFAG